MRADTKELVTTIAYMIGVKKNILENCFDEECHELLETLYTDKDASIIRYLCKLRTTLMQRFKKTDQAVRWYTVNSFSASKALYNGVALIATSSLGGYL